MPVIGRSDSTDSSSECIMSPLITNLYDFEKKGRTF